ncbi:Cyclopentanol dehydrogenase [Microbacterium sp. Bi98]|uniref:SDR family NAD(P)-dependent oxidoreductase n=1 Tax=Microbacterium sp. Bi98 TaxID=2821116 RepID=UPI001D426E9B|nr:SDR family oxidoreductase [Microbacterium sp. Bi98]CAH0257127.1 Cyclopentanol dehydrogenase [Microbacterium sp. Bi98]
MRYLRLRKSDQLEPDSVAELGANARALRADATKLTDMTAVIDEIRAECGRLDVVFANAGAVWQDTIDALSEENLDKGLEVDLKGTIFTVQASLGLLTSGGAILVNTSITQDMGVPGIGVYAAAKAGLRSLVRTWSNELRDKNIRVNAISPGNIQTDILEKMMGTEGAADYIRRVAAQIPSGRIGQPEDIGNAVVFLASDEATFVNGTELTVDGGQTQIYAGTL